MLKLKDSTRKNNKKVIFLNNHEESDVMSDKKQKIAQTQMEKMGFKDPDLYNQLHDRICLWLREPEQINLIYNQFIHVPEEIKKDLKKSSIIGKEDKIRHILDKYKDRISNYILLEDALQNKLKYDQQVENDLLSNTDIKYEIFPEHPIVSYQHIPNSTESNKFILGFIDLKIVFTIEFPGIIDLLIKFRGINHSINWIVENKSEVIDSYLRNEEVEIFIQEQKGYRVRLNLYIEAKSRITTIGSLERELNYYRTHLRKNNEYASFIVACPFPTDYPNFKTVLSQSGILYLECPSDLITELKEIEKQTYFTIEERVTSLEKQVKDIVKSQGKSKSSQTTISNFINPSK